MTTGKDVLDIAKRNFEQARDRKQDDLDAAQGKPALVKAVLDNYGAALATYLETLADAFQAASGNWDQLLKDAADAEKALDDARARAAAIGDRIVALGKLSDAVGKLVEAVKKPRPKAGPAPPAPPPS
jgi:chromosome condensin MukBEF ATPase and DNA-binding subunit MukB